MYMHGGPVNILAAPVFSTLIKHIDCILTMWTYTCDTETHFTPSGKRKNIKQYFSENNNLILSYIKYLNYLILVHPEFTSL